MESLPTLQNFHLALTHDGTAIDAEEELLSVISHLLVCAIEDPGIPNPVRHTTLLGQSLRNADITNGNISEILRIYLYAVATGEVRILHGVTLDRDRERRVPDHHCTDADQPTTASLGKNHTYYELLHNNYTWKLSECLKQQPFVSLNPSVKTQMLAHLCNDLLLNKAVMKQIEGSLESMAQYKREKYLLDNRVRKYRHMHMRKIRMEQFERSQMLARQQAEMQPNQVAAVSVPAVPMVGGFVEPIQPPTTTVAATAATTTVAATGVVPAVGEPATAAAAAGDNNNVPHTPEKDAETTTVAPTDDVENSASATADASLPVSTATPPAVTVTGADEPTTPTTAGNPTVDALPSTPVAPGAPAAAALVKTISNLTNASSMTDVSELANQKDDSMHSTDIAMAGSCNNAITPLAKTNSGIFESPVKVTAAVSSIAATINAVASTADATNKSLDDGFSVAEMTSPLMSTPHAPRAILNNGSSTPDMNSLMNKKIVDMSTNDVTMDDDMSDLESEGTMLEEDEDNRLTADEVAKKLEKILKSSAHNKIMLEQSCNQLRAICHGQDRYWRRYWQLPKTGGIFVEALEAAQPDILKYHSIDDDLLSLQSDESDCDEMDDVRRALKRKSEDDDGSESVPLAAMDGRADDVDEQQTREDAQEPNDEAHQTAVANSSSEAIVADAPNGPDATPEAMACDQGVSTAVAATAVPETPLPAAEKNGNAHDDGLMDIEDSIPTAILVQKANQTDGTIVEVNNQIGGVNVDALGQPNPPAAAEVPAADVQPTPPSADQPPPKSPPPTANEVTTVIDDDDVIEMIDIKPKMENGDVKPNIAVAAAGDGPELKPNVDALNVAMLDMKPPKLEIKIEPIKYEIKEEDNDCEIITIPDDPKTDPPLFDRWFSIANRELPLYSLECDTPESSQIAYANVTCEGVLQSQGNRWDLGNNAHYFNVPIDQITPPLHFNRDSFLTVSGLDEDMMKRAIEQAEQRKLLAEQASAAAQSADADGQMDVDEDDELLQNGRAADTKPADQSHVVPQHTAFHSTPAPAATVHQPSQPSFQSQALVQTSPTTLPFHLPSFINMSLGNISTYIQCDNPAPLQMTPDEHRLLEEVKQKGLPARLERNLVPRAQRFGWWKIDDHGQLNEIVNALHPRGVRERDLRASLMNALSDTLDLGMPCPIGNPGEAPPRRGYLNPEPMSAWSPEIARRVELSLLDQLETLEDKIASASMQIKGWQVPSKDDNSDNAMDVTDNITMIRERILGLEAAIERRYLKPPLGTSTADAHLAAIATQSHNQSSQSSGTERSERNTAAALAAAASAAAAAAEAAALAAAAAAEAAAANPPADGAGGDGQGGDGDGSMEQEESLPEPEIMPKGGCQAGVLMCIHLSNTNTLVCRPMQRCCRGARR